MLVIFIFSSSVLQAKENKEQAPPADQAIYLKVERKPIEAWLKDGAISAELLQRPSFVMKYPMSPIEGHRLYKSPLTGQVHEINRDIEIINLGHQVISAGEANELLGYLIKSFRRDSVAEQAVRDAEAARVREKVEESARKSESGEESKTCQSSK